MLLNRIIRGDNVETLKAFPDECVDLVVTSPPYDDLRAYGGHTWDFTLLAANLIRVLKKGGVIVWVVNDQVIDGSESGTSFTHALEFKALGLRLHDTMIYSKGKCIYPDPKRYGASFEYMFVFSKGEPKTVNKIKDRVNRWGGTMSRGRTSERKRDSSIKQREYFPIEEIGYRLNVWNIANGFGNEEITEHPAAFPLSLATDHIRSWSNPDDLVLDPFSGSGTTCLAAKELGRRWLGIEIEPKYCAIAERRMAQEVLPLSSLQLTGGLQT